MHLEVHNVEDYSSPEVHALHLIAAAILTHATIMQKGFQLMSNDFSKLTAGFDALAAAITSVVADLQNPAVDNNDQSVIDGLSAKLDGAVQALTAADSAFKAAATPAPAGTSTPALPSDTTGGVIPGTVASDPVAADGSASTDVTP